MKTILKAIPWLLLLSVLCGCSYHTYTKTIILPDQSQSSVPEDSDSDSDWELKKMYQYQYTSTNFSGNLDGLSSTIGWSGDDDTLYTLDGAPEEEVVVYKVDIRYGFYDQCSSLGVLNYNHMQISPDGKYVLYDAVNPETGKLLLYLHTVSEQTTRELMEFPNPSPYLELNFIWTQNGSSFFFWFAPDYLRLEMMDYKPGIFEEFFKTLLSEEGLPLTQLSVYDITSEQTICLLTLDPEVFFYEDGFIFSSFYRTVLPNADGSRAVITQKDEYLPYIYEKSTQKVTPADMELFDSYGILPEDFAYIGITNHNICARNAYDNTILFLTGTGSNLRIKDYMAVESFSKDSALLNVQKDFKSVLSNDEKHMITIECGNSGESLVYLYDYHADSSTPQTLSGRTLLYQTPDNISEISITPDDRHIILKTQEATVRNAFVYDTESDEPMVSTLFKYTIVVLEL